jgi:hypothetical protein
MDENVKRLLTRIFGLCVFLGPISLPLAIFGVFTWEEYVKMWIALIFLRLWAVVVMIDPDSLD